MNLPFLEYTIDNYPLLWIAAFVLFMLAQATRKDPPNG